MYCCKYVSKADNLLKEATSIILENTEAKRMQERRNIIAMWHQAATASLKFPSVLDPSRANPVRVSLRLLQNVLNRTSGLQELSSHQLAAQALSIPSCYSSDTFVYIYVAACMVFLCSQKNKTPSTPSTALRTVPPEVADWLVKTLGIESTWLVLQFLPTDDPSLASDPTLDKHAYAPRMILKTDHGFVSVDQLRDYYWRPRVLWHYGLDEFVAVFVRKKKQKIPSDNDNDEERYCIPGDNGSLLTLDGTGKYEFNPEYEGQRCFYLQLRTVHVTSMFTSKCPTISDCKTAKGKKRFALFYATLLVPFWPPPAEDGTPIRVNGYLSAENYCEYDAFSDLMSRWSDPSAAFIHRCRYYKLHNLVHSLATDNSVRKLLHAQKTQYVQRWSAMNPADPPNCPTASDHVTTDHDGGEASHAPDLLLDFEFAPVNHNALHRREHLATIKKSLYSLHSRPGSTRPTFDNDDYKGCAWGNDWSQATAADALQRQLAWLKQPLPITTSLQRCVAGSMRASFGSVTASVAVDGECWMIQTLPESGIVTHTTPLTPFRNKRGHFPPRSPSVFYAGQGFIQALASTGTVTGSGSGATSGTVCHHFLQFLNRSPPESPERPAVVTAYRLLHALLDPSTVVMAHSRGTAILRDTLNAQQKVFSDRVVDNVLGGRPTYHLLCGGAGAGKSYVVANIEHRLSEMGFRCRAVSYQWRYVPPTLPKIAVDSRHLRATFMNVPVPASPSHRHICTLAAPCLQ